MYKHTASASTLHFIVQHIQLFPRRFIQIHNHKLVTDLEVVVRQIGLKVQRVHSVW